MFKKTTQTVIFLLVLVTFSYAQVEKGDREVVFSGMLMSMVGIEDYSFTTVSLTLSYGYFLTDKFEIGIGPTLTYTRTKQTTTSYDWYSGTTIEEEHIEENKHISGYFFFNYNLSTSSKTVPYISGQWYQSDFEIEKDEEFTDYSFANIGFGVRNFINEYAALNTSINYGFSLAKEAEGGILLILSGVSVIF